MAIPMRPISCEEARQEAARRVFEPVEAHVEATLAAHLAACEECRLHADEVQRAARMLGASLLAADPPEALERRVTEAIRRQPDDVRRTRHRLYATLTAVALVVGGLVLSLWPATEAPSREATLAPADRFERASGTASVLGEGPGARLRLQVSGLPSLEGGSAYAVWVGGGSDRWHRLGLFRATTIDSFYELHLPIPESLRITIERIDAGPDIPGPPVLTGRW